MNRMRAFLLAVVAALAVAGCNGTRSTRLDGTPRIPVRERFQYQPLDPHTKAAPTEMPQRAVNPTPKAAAPPAGAAAWLPVVKERPWQWIVIHHSATQRGSATVFDDWHRNGRHWDELGYHFVIGNGTDSGDGQVEVGSRWTKQKHGAHCKVWNREEYNQVGIGICLVGNFEEARPSAAQMDALVALVDWLSARYRIPDERIIGHNAVCDTDCPGRHLLLEDVRKRLRARRGSS